MKTDALYSELVLRMHQIAVVPPQTIGPFTVVYKRIVPHFKVAPWRGAVGIAIFASILLYVLFGPSIVKIASLLQFGF